MLIYVNSSELESESTTLKQFLESNQNGDQILNATFDTFMAEDKEVELLPIS
jgi:hypothetical protein